MKKNESKTVFAKLRSACSQLAILPSALRLAWSAAPGWLAASAGLTLVQGLLPVAFVWLVRDLINTFSSEPFDSLNRVDWWALAPLLIPFGLVLLAIEGLQPLSRWIRAAQSEYVERYIRDLVQSQANRADLAFFETPEFLDQLYRAGPEGGTRINSLLEGLALILQSAVTVGALAVILIPYAWWLPLCLGISLVPALGVVIADAWRQGDWWRKATRNERQADYFNWLITSGINAAELRLHHLGDYFQNKHRDLQRKLATGRLSLERRHAFTAVLAATAGVVIAAMALALLAFNPSGRSVVLGDVVAIFQAFYQSQRAAKSMLSQLGSLVRQSIQLQSLYQYLDCSPEITSPTGPQAGPQPLRKEIRFEKVSFSYEGNTKPSLKELSARIPAGKITAIVGENGSGKSTLVKLLTRLYDPDSGAIYLDETDIRKMDPTDLREQFGVLLQDPLQLQGTVCENIRLGRFETDTDLEEKLRLAAEATGADHFIDSLENGFETPLGRWFDSGTDLSTGQWQRLALSRAIFRNAPVLVFDEPTSSMDTVTEAEWVNKLPEMAADKTVILITHRLAPAVSADQIIVLAKGRVIESGSHEELVAAGGNYATFCNAQSSHST